MKSMNEEWKDIKGFEGIFQISNLGIIKRLPYKANNGTNKCREIKEKILEPFTWQSRYLRVDLQFTKDGIKHRRATYVHNLVAETFIGERPEGYVIDHINRDYLDNRVCNLRYVTQCDNVNNCNKEQWSKNISKTLNSKKPCVGRKYVSKDNISKMVKSEELQTYLDNGWHLGFDVCKHKRRA